jgi:hypothetical protein
MLSENSVSYLVVRGNDEKKTFWDDESDYDGYESDLSEDCDRYEDLIDSYLAKNDPSNREKPRDKKAKRIPGLDRNRGGKSKKRCNVRFV